MSAVRRSPVKTEYILLLDLWRAWRDDEGPYGDGKTEQEAIDDLIEQEIEE